MSALMVLWQQAVTAPLVIPPWEGLAALVVFAGAWGVALYRLNLHQKYHQKHFEHQGDMNLHQTPNERQALAAELLQHNIAHEALDNFRFAHIDKKMDEMSGDIKTILRAVKPE